MYARVWRRWSLNTNRMSFLWLAAVTLLLLILCAPTTTTTTTFAMTTTNASRQNAAGAAAAVEAKAAVVAASAASYTYNRGRLWQRWPSRPSAAAAVAAEDAGVAERSFFIPVRANAEESSGSSSNAASRPASYQLQPPKNSPSSRNRSCSSSSSKIPSSSKLFRSSFQQQQQKRLQQQQQQHADRLAQSQYYKTPATAAQKPSATVFANSNNSPPTALREQQHIYVAHEGADYEEDEEVDEEEAGDDEGVEDEINEENENEDEAESEADTSEEHVADNADLATFNNNFNRNSKLVPSDASSQANTLYNRLVRQRQPTPQLQRQSPGNTAATTTRAHNTKARRHVQQSVDVNHKKLHQQQQQQQQKQLLPATGFHSPVRETATVSSNPSSPTARTRNKSATLPFRYFIETFEIPATLPFTGDLTQQQRLMLLQSEQLRRWQLDQQQQQQAARSRRDSRPFVGLSTAGSSSGSNSYQQQHYYSAQQQQQLQLQPYQRVQHQQHLNPSNTFYPKQHHKTHSNQQEQQHQHQNQMHHQHQHQHPHQRNNRRRRYCSARDPAQLAFEAPTVFEGKIVSMTPDRTANFSATVEVKEIFKQQIGYRLQRYLRLQFTYRNTSGECDIYREQLRPRGLVRGDELEQGRIYLLFVQQIDLGNFTILGQPIRKTRRVVEAVKNAVSENYAQLAAIRSITASNRTVENGKELRIVCKVQGRPPPKVTWFKDHKSINRNRRLYQIVPYKKRSELIIKSFNSSDAGRYECRAKNKVNRNLERRAIVIKAYPVPRYETHLTGGTGHTCPPDAAEFCFNGGTCKLFVEIGSYSCICPEGFIGERCDRKEVNNMPPNPTYKTGYIADDPNAYDAKLHFDTDKSGAAENPSPPVDSANDDSEEEDDSLEEY